MITTQGSSLRARLLVIALMAFLGSLPVICHAQPVTKLWEVTIGTGVRLAPAIGMDGTIYAASGSPDTTFVNTNTRTLYAISPEGTTNWTFTAGATIRSAPVIGVDGTIYFGAADGLYALNPSGVTNWIIHPGGPLCSSPAIGADGTIYLVTRTNVSMQAYPSILHSISPTGTVNWTCSLGNGGWSGSAQFPSPAIGPDSSIYVSSLSGQLYSISYSGMTNWIFPLGVVTFASPAIGSDGTIYLGTDGGKVHAIGRNGSQRWAYTGAGVVESAPVIDQAGNTYFGSIQGVFTCLNSNGVRTWFRNGSSISGSAALAADGTVYVTSYDSGKLFAYSSAGSNLWSFTCGESFSSPVIGSDGTIYVGGGTKLYAIAGASPPQNSSWPMFRRTPYNIARSPQRSIQDIRSLPDGNVEMRLLGETGGLYEVEASTNLTSWESLAGFNFAAPSIPFADLSATNYPQRYYRLSMPR